MISTQPTGSPGRAGRRAETGARPTLHRSAAVLGILHPRRFRDFHVLKVVHVPCIVPFEWEQVGEVPKSGVAWRRGSESSRHLLANGGRAARRIDPEADLLERRCTEIYLQHLRVQKADLALNVKSTKCLAANVIAVVAVGSPTAGRCQSCFCS